MDDHKGHAVNHDINISLYGEVRALRIKWLAKLILPPIPPAVTGLLLTLDVIRLPGGPLGHILILVPVRCAYALFWASMIRAARTDKAWLNLARSHFQKRLPSITAESAQKHTEAQEILSAFAEDLQPFVLFLRNFEIEAVTIRGRLLAKTRNDPMVGLIYTLEPGRIEMRLAQALAGRVPVLGIANPSNFHPTGDVVPKLELPDDSWKEILHTLVRSASLIVIEASHFSPGVAYELNTIREHDKQDFAIVVVLRKGSDDTNRIRLIRELAEILIESDVAPPEQLSKQSEQLIDFPRVVNEDEVPFDNLDSSPYFADILAQIDFFVALNPEQRRKRVQANIANRNGVALMREGRLTDAQGPLLEGLALRQEIGDMIGQVISYLNVGTMFKGLEDYATAESHYRSGLKVPQELGDKVGAGLLLSGLAEIRRISGDAGSALAFLQEASELLDQNRKPKELMLILHSIGELRREGDENALAIAAYTRAAEIAREAHEEATLALSLREIGVTFARNDDPSNAIPPVLESLEISRKLGDVQSEGEALVLLATLSHKAEDEPRVQQYSRDALALYKRTGGPEIAKSVQEVLERHGVVLHVDANSLMRNGSEIRNTETVIGLVLIADCLTSRSSGRREKAAPLLTLGVIAPRKAWRCFPGESPCRVRANHPPVSSLASVAESRGDEFARDHLVQ